MCRSIFIFNLLYFRFDFNNPVLKNLTYLQPYMTLHSDRLTSLITVFKNVPRIVSFHNAEELQNIDDEWRKLEDFALSDTVKAIEDTEHFWSCLYKFEIDGDYPFKCLF